MELNEPIFREVIVSWYDSAVVCLSMIVFMVMVFVFGLFGISAALEKIEYQQHLWVPVALTVMSFYVGISFTLRHIRRNTRQRRRRD